MKPFRQVGFSESTKETEGQDLGDERQKTKKQEPQENQQRATREIDTHKNPEKRERETASEKRRSPTGKRLFRSIIKKNFGGALPSTRPWEPRKRKTGKTA